MTMSIEIRKIGAEDVTTLRELAMATFSQTFKDEYTEEEFKTYFETALSEDTLRQELMSPQSQHFSLLLTASRLVF